MFKHLILLFVLISANTFLFSSMITVKQDGSGDYTQIQTAIDGAETGDTITVFPGTYFENINFIGKDLFLCSLFHITDEENYIDSTIIDGNNNGTVLCFNNNETNAATLKGFTIQNGSGFQLSPNIVIGGGVYINYSSPSLISNKIINNKARLGGA